VGTHVAHADVVRSVVGLVFLCHDRSTNGPADGRVHEVAQPILELFDLLATLAYQLLGCFFFFSSRRRHTRLVSDWSSDVCSSDLSRNPGLAKERSERFLPEEAV